MNNVSTLAEQLCTGDRRALARAITLVESARADHRDAAEELIAHIGKRGDDALRIGLSGTPGVGKSTFIEALGVKLTGAGAKVAVLAVDPTSARTGGSILGDKTRMDVLSRDPNAFIQPSPAGNSLGGVARRTREAAILCAAAGYDHILIETVGVGQSEVSVAGMTDIFLLLMAPAGGDELQGVKRGIMEIADLILVNKADGGLEAAATRTCADYAGALRLMRRRPDDSDKVPGAMLVSAQTGRGMDDAWSTVLDVVSDRKANGFFANRRAEQALDWYRNELHDGLLAQLEQPEIAALNDAAKARVAHGDTTPVLAARDVLNKLAKR